MKKFTTLIAAITCTFNISAQQCISKAKLLTGYNQQYVLCNEVPDMSSYDKLTYYPEIFADHEEGDYHVYVSKNEQLRQAGRLLLPPSMYCLQENTDMENTPNDGEKQLRLYWLGTLDSLSTKGNNMLKNKLKKEYGSIILQDSIEAVPVIWFDGELFETSNPDWHGGFPISSSQKELTFQKGMLVSKNRRFSLSSLYRDCNGITRINPNIYIIDDSPEMNELYKIYSFNLLARDLTREVRRMGADNHTYTNSYPMLITIDGNNKAHIEPVYPDSLNAEDKELLNPLMEAMELQPAGILSERWTVNGQRYGAYFVKATYNEKNISWTLEEYPRLHLRHGEKVDRWNKGRKGYDNR